MHASTPVRRSSASRTHQPARRSTRRHAGPGRPAPSAPGRPPSPQRPDHPWHGSTTRRPTSTPVINGTPTRSHRCHRRSGGSCSVIVAAVLSTGFQRREEETGIVAYCLAVRPADGDRTWTVVDASYATVGPVEAGGAPAPVVAEHGPRLRGLAGAVVVVPGAVRRGGAVGRGWGPGGGGVLVVATHRPHRRACSDSAVRGSVGGDAARAAGRADLVLPVAGGGPLGAGRGAAAARAGCPDAVTRIARAPGRQAPAGSVIAGQGAPPPGGPA